jgi:hypothetical protein
MLHLPISDQCVVSPGLRGATSRRRRDQIQSRATHLLINGADLSIATDQTMSREADAAPAGRQS